MSCSWLLAKEPAERPPDLRTAVRALEQAGRDAGITAPASGWDTGPVGLSSAQTQPPVAVPRRSHLVAAAAAPTVGGKRPATTQQPVPKSRAPLFAVIAGAAVLAVAGFVVVNGRSGGDQKPAAAPLVHPSRRRYPRRRPHPSRRSLPR